MISFKEYIREELADTLSAKNAVDYDIIRQARNGMDASFKIGEETFIYSFTFMGEDEINEVKGTFSHVEFFNKKRGYGITGTGNVSKVFATVFQLLKESIDDFKPDVIYFDKSKEGRSRGSLYKRFVNKAENLLPGYKGVVLSETQYSIVKKEFKDKVNLDEV